MDKNIKSNKTFGGGVDYKEKIIELIENINNHGILEYLYTFIRLFLEKWG